MRKEDLDKIITAALNVANENASVYGSQITKDHKDKIIFRPDSYIKIAVEEPIIPLVDPPVDPPADLSKTDLSPDGKTEEDAKKTANPSGGGQSLSRITMDWQEANSASEMFQQFFQAVLEAYKGDNLKSVGFYKVDPAAGVPKPLETLDDIYFFAHKLETKLKSIKYTLEFGVATVGQGERGGERILSLYDVISSPKELDFANFPQYKIRTINALLQIDAQIRNEIIKKTSTPTMLENIRDFDKNSGWWNTLKDSFKGIQESLITRN